MAASQSFSKYYMSLDTASKQHYLAKLTLSTGEQLPDPMTLDCDWSNDIVHLPCLSWRDVTDYLIDSPSTFTKDSLKAYKSLEAYDYFMCGHVQDCFDRFISNKSEFCYIKLKVRDI